MRTVGLFVVVLMCLGAFGCKRNAYYNFTEYAQYTQHIQGPRTFSHIYQSSELGQDVTYHDTVITIEVIDNATISIGDTRLKLQSNTDNTLTFANGAQATLVFNFVNSAIVFKRAAQQSNSASWYSFDVFTAY